MNRRSLVLGAAAGALLAFGGAAFYFSGNNAEGPAPKSVENSILERPHSPTVGPDDAPVTIVEFFDPACEACRAFHPVVKEIMGIFPGKTRLVLRYAAFHEPSADAIALLEAARMQGLFEPVLEQLYATQSEWAPHGKPPIDVWEVVGKTGLDIELARSQAKLPEVVSVLNQDAADIEATGIRGTPSFFVNGKPLTEFGPQHLFALVKAEVQAAGD